MNNDGHTRQRLWAQQDAPRRLTNPVVTTVGIGALVLVVLFLLYAVWGVQAIRRALIAETERNGVALLESIVQASQYSMTASTMFNRLTDRLNWEYLATRAYFAAENVPKPVDDSASLKATAVLAEADGISLWTRGKITAVLPNRLDTLMREDPNVASTRWNPANHSATSFEIDDTATGDRWMGAGVSTAWGGIALWQRVPAEDNRPTWSGVGILLQDIGRRSEINYIMLQSPEGIVFASRPLPPVLKLADDEFLVEALGDTAAVSRELIFENVPVLEVVRPFLPDDFPGGVFRVGISLEGVEAAQRRLMVQLGLSALLFVLLATAALGFLVSRRSYADLSRSYQRVETLTQRILDAMDQAVIAIDADGRLTVFNRAAEVLFGRVLSAFKDPTIANVLGCDDYHLQDIANGADPIHAGEHHFRMGDRVRQLAFSTTPVITADGRREGAVSVVRDETDARELQERVERTRRLTEMGDLAAGVAHEIRNPLNAIALAAQRLKMEMADAESGQMATTVLEESQRLNKIVEDFLSLARTSTQPRHTIDFSDLLKSVGSMAELEACQKDVNWSMHCVPHLCVSGMNDELRKAVWNLLSNALAATPAGGSITVRLEGDRKMVTLTIDDTGEGINPEDLSRIYQPYFTTKSTGTGLGLAITHRIVTDHGGRIAVQSPPPDADMGTRVSVDLPQVDHPRADQKK